MRWLLTRAVQIVHLCAWLIACGSRTPAPDDDFGGTPDAAVSRDRTDARGHDAGRARDTGVDAPIDATGFDPTTIPGLVLWVEADHLGAPAGPGGPDGGIATWPDQSGHHNDLTTVLNQGYGAPVGALPTASSTSGGLPLLHFPSYVGLGATTPAFAVPATTAVLGSGGYTIAVVARFPTNSTATLVEIGDNGLDIFTYRAGMTGVTTMADGGWYSLSGPGTNALRNDQLFSEVLCAVNGAVRQPCSLYWFVSSYANDRNPSECLGFPPSPNLYDPRVAVGALPLSPIATADEPSGLALGADLAEVLFVVGNISVADCTLLAAYLTEKYSIRVPAP